jgi:hypothetical protein
VGFKVNGEYRKKNWPYKGVRQCDPLSPLLFNLVVDALATMLDRTKLTGLVKGLVPNLVEGGLTHLQYVDDTVIFLEAEEEYVVNLKFILYCFENISGLKINFHKSEVIVVGTSKEEGARIANCLNCKERELPMKYLGIPITIDKLYIADLMYVGLKVENRLPAW